MKLLMIGVVVFCSGLLWMMFKEQTPNIVPMVNADDLATIPTLVNGLFQTENAWFTRDAEKGGNPLFLIVSVALVAEKEVRITKL